jgi:hypothetical protein
VTEPPVSFNGLLAINLITSIRLGIADFAKYPIICFAIATASSVLKVFLGHESRQLLGDSCRDQLVDRNTLATSYIADLLMK